ncbi:ABC transporter ATP-binding protein [Azonexus caeni]|uniref:ABC transporter ATP-binding protein n=1 Tax=Azonexus caeni TaxID=266126 RepID=UPI003A838393
MKHPVIELNQVVKHYRIGDNQISALRGVDLQLQARDFAAIRGPSGSGKSTLLNICGLIDRIDGGSYRLAGEDISELDEAACTEIRRKRMGFIFQNYNLVPVMSVFDNVEYPLLLNNVPKAERRALVSDILDKVGLTGFAERKPDQLSGGQRQRVAIARALVKAPLLVIADEPTANLDTDTAEHIVELMKSLGHRLGTSFLIATHDDRMTRHCDTVFSMQDGVIE